MPCLRGLEVSLTTKPDNEQIPEYPHPEGTSARFLGSLVRDPQGLAVGHKAGPTVSVYIPSIPATRFAVSYSINNAPLAPCKYLFFRLYINARPIAAWGVDSSVCTKGKVVRSLWAPSPLHNGEVGFEGRKFVFLPGQERKSVAEDGGLIEIRVFRARERRARAPKLEEFRYQENYGIAAPSVGLLDRPQDVCFYDWHLLDAKDSPFASFRLHYRSLQNLKQLNLIPPTELELIHSLSPKALRNSVTIEQSCANSDYGSEEQSVQSGSSDEAVFHDCAEEYTAGGHGDDEAKHYFLQSPRELFPAMPTRLSVPQPSKALRDAYREAYLHRPLPALPRDEPKRLSRRSSAASALSATPSITPSLRQYVDAGSLSPDEIELGVAQLVRLPSSNSTLNVTPDEEATQAADHSISDYETSPKSPGDFFSGKRLSPGRYLPMTGSGLERGIALFSSPPQSAATMPHGAWQSLPIDFSSDHCSFRLETVTLSDAEWVSRSPSPARTPAADLASPSGRGHDSEKVGGRFLFGGLRRRRFNGSPRRLAGMVLGRGAAKVEDGSGTVQRGRGNWV